MKRFTPYIFPLVVLAIVFFLVYRWYNMRNQQGDTSQYGEGIQIENLSDADLDTVIRGTGDFKTSPLEMSENTASTVEGIGSVRYEVKDGKVRFSVAADLPEPKTPYHVWIQTRGGDNLTKAFDLELGKGGYMGTAAVSQDLLPLEVFVSQAGDKGQVMDQVILKGVIENSQETTP
ncbi:MAG: hypothetical protein COY81_01075 [Candidatus Pacebacteria bacterium CG_4_10_14_0_8_um_filter_43_12]|nr:MAG: hypothetical protein COU66_01510 [Candidatus Pacebacteria bacterium CG10_big_fil_rev_8_21_14_0_10_44_11]PIY79739.1 MAG: hypothetical protein COY81_01075 [Candidatus Pacebacteria bacterium CG_4_10_14_0_8_um_filter_43_12]